jgi:hypothetical protein
MVGSDLCRMTDFSRHHVRSKRLDQEMACRRGRLRPSLYGVVTLVMKAKMAVKYRSVSFSESFGRMLGG